MGEVARRVSGVTVGAAVRVKGVACHPGNRASDYPGRGCVGPPLPEDGTSVRETGRSIEAVSRIIAQAISGRGGVVGPAVPDRPFRGVRDDNCANIDDARMARGQGRTPSHVRSTSFHRPPRSRQMSTSSHAPIAGRRQSSVRRSRIAPPPARNRNGLMRGGRHCGVIQRAWARASRAARPCHDRSSGRARG